MSLPARQHCFQHPEREAIARCMECRESFCRECITEHGERLICAACLGKLAGAVKAHAGRWRELAGALLTTLLGIGCTWSVFYGLGRLLLMIPSTWHDRNLWGRMFG